MQKYNDAMHIMAERFGKDSLIAIATTDGTSIFALSVRNGRSEYDRTRTCQRRNYAFHARQI